MERSSSIHNKLISVTTGRCLWLEQHCSKWGPWTSSISILWGLVEMQTLRSHPRPPESGSLEVEPAVCGGMF